MNAWRHGWPVAVVCLIVLALVGLRLAHFASDAAAATREAQFATYGTTDPNDLGNPTGRGNP